MACILLWSSAVRVHDSQTYRKMDVTRERISCILELRKIPLSFQTGFDLVNATVAMSALCPPLSMRYRAIEMTTIMIIVIIIHFAPLKVSRRA